ncbi:MAG: YfiR family protein [Verrucomicrobia bacterium]|nr:YfiR family protein [Verrucomicrobiota bacterium]
MSGRLWLLAGRLLFLLVLLAPEGMECLAQTPAPTEYQVKAAFLYNFAKFVEWPSVSAASNDAPFVVGVLGRNPFGADLDQILKDKIVNRRPVKIKQCETAQAARNCQILFIGATEETRLPQIFEALKGAAVLTVSDIRRFADRGGMICFVMEENKVRFEINKSNAQQAGLTVSAQLLKLAKVVHNNPSERKE